MTGHSIEFRINAEDAGRNFMPAPAPLAWRPPSGPGVRVDEGYRAGMTVPGSFDSLVAKIIVTGADRTQALARSRRALRELVVEGMPTVLPFHRAVLDDPAFAPSTGVRRAYPLDRDECGAEIGPYAGPVEADRSRSRKSKVVVEVNGKRLEGDAGRTRRRERHRRAEPAGQARTPRWRRRRSGKAPSGDALTSPMQGTIVKVAVADGDRCRPATWWCWRR